MKVCAYCGCKNDDNAVSCRGCGTTEFKNDKSAQSPAESDQNNKALEKDDFTCRFGRFQVWEAERIFKRFEEEGVRFEFIVDDSRLRGMSAWQASVGGCYGSGTLVEIFTHREDEKKARKILGEFFKV